MPGLLPPEDPLGIPPPPSEVLLCHGPGYSSWLEYWLLLVFILNILREHGHCNQVFWKLSNSQYSEKLLSICFICGICFIFVTVINLGTKGLLVWPSRSYIEQPLCRMLKSYRASLKIIGLDPVKQ